MSEHNHADQELLRSQTADSTSTQKAASPAPDTPPQGPASDTVPVPEDGAPPPSGAAPARAPASLVQTDLTQDDDSAQGIAQLRLENEAEATERKAVASLVEEHLRNIVLSDMFNNFILIVIIINAVALGFLTSRNFNPEFRHLMIIIDHVAIGIFVVEMFLKIYCLKWEFFKNPWNVFDLTVTALSLVPITDHRSVLSCFRFLRVLRIISAIHRLSKQLNSLLKSLNSIFWLIVLAGIFFYIYSVVGTTLFASYNPEYFGNFGASAFTLFQMMTLESWASVIARPTMEHEPLFGIYFVSFIVIETYIILNLFITILIEAVTRQYAEDDERREQEHLKALEKSILQLNEKLDSLQPLLRLIQNDGQEEGAAKAAELGTKLKQDKQRSAAKTVKKSGFLTRFARKVFGSSNTDDHRVELTKITNQNFKDGQRAVAEQTSAGANDTKAPAEDEARAKSTDPETLQHPENVPPEPEPGKVTGSETAAAQASQDRPKSRRGLKAFVRPLSRLFGRKARDSAAPQEGTPTSPAAEGVNQDNLWQEQPPQESAALAGANDAPAAVEFDQEQALPTPAALPDRELTPAENLTDTAYAGSGRAEAPEDEGKEREGRTEDDNAEPGDRSMPDAMAQAEESYDTAAMRASEDGTDGEVTDARRQEQVEQEAQERAQPPLIPPVYHEGLYDFDDEDIGHQNGYRAEREVTAVKTEPDSADQSSGTAKSWLSRKVKSWLKPAARYLHTSKSKRH
ncbi:MAG: ion transporter [Succinivibrio sp.]|nr:ion transporter [Succinivibrio sp.]